MIMNITRVVGQAAGRASRVPVESRCSEVVLEAMDDMATRASEYQQSGIG